MPESHPNTKHSAWIVILVTFFLCLGGIVGFNAYVDPFGIYGTNIYQPSEINMYQFKLDLFREYQPRPEALILGSSRAWRLDPDQVTRLTGMRCYNWFVSGSKSEVNYSILRLALEDFDSPLKIVIVAVEPEAFHPTREVFAQALYIDEYAKYLPRHLFWSMLQERMSRSVSLEQIQASIDSVNAHRRGEVEPFESKWYENGLRILAPLTLEANATRLERNLEIYAPRRWQIQNFTHLSEDRKDYWIKFLEVCEKNDIDVYAFGPPMHPDLYQNLIDAGAGPIFDEMDAFMEETSEEYGFTYRNFTVLEDLPGASTDDFYDGVHTSGELPGLIINELLGENRPDLNN